MAWCGAFKASEACAAEHLAAMNHDVVARVNGAVVAAHLVNFCVVEREALACTSMLAHDRVDDRRDGMVILPMNRA
jgi:hypothetical protein